MELTLESALSPGGMVGHTAYMLLVLSMCMRSMFWLRILVIASALVAIAYAVIWLNDPVSGFWETLLVTVNVIQITREWMLERRARFSPEENAFVAARLGTLTRAQARRFLDMGVWANAESGTVLTTEGEPVAQLVYIVSGRVDILVQDRRVGSCLPGNFVGEMSVLGHKPASATAVVAEPTRYWLIPSEKIQSLQVKEPQVAAAFQTGIAHDLRNKIVAGNSTAAKPV